MIGSIISHYRVVRQLGKGGMGEVYEAVDEQLGRRVAIKVLLKHYAQDADVTARFFNEARSVNVIGHPGLVQVYEFGQIPSGGAYLVMEYLNGVTLSDRLKEGGMLGEIAALQVALQLSSALAAAHEKDIVHRDLKPSNVMILPDPTLPGGERVKLLDFGIAKLGSQNASADQPKTRTGLAIGTPMYMSPEQCRGAKNLDGKADVYSLGVILYQMLSGRVPFDAEGEGAVLGMHLYEEPPPLEQVAPHVTPSVSALVHRMLIKKAEERPSMKEVEDVLREMGAAVLPSITRHSTKLAVVSASKASASMPQIMGSKSSQSLPRTSGAITPTTLGASNGQVVKRQRKLLLGGVAAALTLVVLVVGLRLRANGVNDRTPPLSAPKVHWQINSTPSGALILRATDQKVIGQTPWQQEQDAASGTFSIVLHHDGFQDRPLTLDNSKDLIREEALTPLPATAETPEHPGPGGARKGLRSGSKGPGVKSPGSKPNIQNFLLPKRKNGKQTQLID